MFNLKYMQIFLEENFFIFIPLFFATTSDAVSRISAVAHMHKYFKTLTWTYFIYIQVKFFADKQTFIMKLS